MKTITKVLLSILIFCGGGLFVSAIETGMGRSPILVFIFYPAIIAGTIAVWKYNPENKDNDSHKRLEPMPQNLPPEEVEEVANCFLATYKTDIGELVVEQESNSGSPERNDKAFLNNTVAKDGKYKLGFLWYVHIKNGVVQGTTVF